MVAGMVGGALEGCMEATRSCNCSSADSMPEPAGHEEECIAAVPCTSQLMRGFLSVTLGPALIVAI